MTGERAGKVMVVTGGSRGIGRVIGAAFAREGAHVVLTASSETNLAKAADGIAASGAKRPLTIAADLREAEGCAAVLSKVKAELGRCDVLVNCAGATKAGAFLEQPDTDWQDGFALKLFAAVRLSRLFWPMLKEAQGFVVNIIGGAARVPDPEFMVGGSVNAAFANFSKALSELGKRDGINVNAILPGQTETERIEELFQQRAAAMGTTPDEVRARALAKQGLRRLATPEDVAELTLFLASERARHIQGTSIAVDGGATPGVY